MSARTNATAPTGGENPSWRGEDRDGDHGGDSERGADRLAPDPVALPHQDVEHQDQDRLGHPIGLGPAQRHADRRADAHDGAEHDRHGGGNRRGEARLPRPPRGRRSDGRRDAVQRCDADDHAIDHGVPPRRHRNDERGSVGDHQQRSEPPEPDPGAREDAHGRQQRHPPPVVGGKRSEPRGEPHPRCDPRHPASAAELGTHPAEQERRRTSPLAANSRSAPTAAGPEGQRRPEQHRAHAPSATRTACPRLRPLSPGGSHPFPRLRSVRPCSCRRRTRRRPERLCQWVLERRVSPFSQQESAGISAYRGCQVSALVSLCCSRRCPRRGGGPRRGRRSRMIARAGP